MKQKIESTNLRFIDLFAGIGGFRLGFEHAGFNCVFSSEIDNHACQIYQENFGDMPKGDITKISPDEIADFDVLCAGFPCQTFSISGKQKGFYDDTRGTLFFDICRIIEKKMPTAFVLENVKNLEKHDNGQTLSIIEHSLMKLGYNIDYKVLNAKDFGVPQNRERIIIVGNRIGRHFDFTKLNQKPINSMKPFLDNTGFEFLDKSEYTIIDSPKIQQKSGLIFVGYRNKKMRTKGVRAGTESLSRVHKQPNRIYSVHGIHPTLASQEKSGRYWIYDGTNVRKLTLNECYKLMGFPKSFKRFGPTSKQYERIGNSVCVPMIKELAKEIKKQFFEGDVNIMSGRDNATELLEKIYEKAVKLGNLNKIQLTNSQLNKIKMIVDHEETHKGVFTVLVTSLTYKILYPNQDVRRHQFNMENGYSGRSFDTKYITPFLKSKRFYGAMKESGWLTRSLEQNLPYDLNFPGKINNLSVKQSFLEILDEIQSNPSLAEEYLLCLFYLSIVEKSKKMVVLVNPIQAETKISIAEIIEHLNEHFYFKYKSRGASILPVVALYSIYELIIDELARFGNKKLEELSSHNSCDSSSGNAGDIVVKDCDTNEIFEVVEVKFDIPINKIMVEDVYKKIAQTSIQRYYILSTKGPVAEEIDEINELITKIRKEHGCQLIINGIFPTLKYYLRLLENTDVFVEKYINNLLISTEINSEHKIAWNKVISAKQNGADFIQ